MHLQEAQEKSQRALELLPCDVVRNAKTFRDYIDFFVSGSSGEIEGMAEAGIDIGAVKLPPDMRKLLDELGDIEGISERLKSEILQDDDARKVRRLFAGVIRPFHSHLYPAPDLVHAWPRTYVHLLCYFPSLHGTDDDATRTGNLKKLVGAAEKALLALTERDALATIVHQEQKQKQKRNGQSSLTRRPTAFAFDHLDQKRYEEATAGHTHTVRAHSEPPPNAPRRPVEPVPRTGSETSIRGPGNEPAFFLSTRTASPVRGRRGRSGSGSGSSSSSSSVSNSSSSGPSGS